MQKKISILKNRRIVKITGPDNREFLNNILTSDVLKLTNDEVSPSALLTPQGKILFDLLIFYNSINQSIYIECSENQLDEFVKKLKLYSLRKDISIIKSDLKVLVTNNLKISERVKIDLRFSKMDVGRVYIKPSDLICNKFGELDDVLQWYFQAKIDDCVPEGEEEIPANKIFPFEIGMFINNGVSFEKGCFIGQEVLARVKYKGKTKNRFSSFQSLTKERLNFDKNFRTLTLDNLDIGEIVFLRQTENNNAFGFSLMKTRYLNAKNKTLKCFYKNYSLNINYDNNI